MSATQLVNGWYGKHAPAMERVKVVGITPRRAAEVTTSGGWMYVNIISQERDGRLRGRTSGAMEAWEVGTYLRDVKRYA